MTEPRAHDGGKGSRDSVRPEESLIRGGLQGVALVTLATAALAAAAALVAVVVALLFS